MQIKMFVPLTALAFLLTGVATRTAQQIPPVGGNAPGRPSQPGDGAQGPGQGAARAQQPPPFTVMSTSMADGSVQTNGNPGQGGNVGYRPPCPPTGPSHHYAFELFSIDQRLDLPETATRTDVMRAIDGHILAHAALIAPYHQ